MGDLIPFPTSNTRHLDILTAELAQQASVVDRKAAETLRSAEQLLGEIIVGDFKHPEPPDDKPA